MDLRVEGGGWMDERAGVSFTSSCRLAFFYLYDNPCFGARVVSLPWWFRGTSLYNSWLFPILILILVLLGRFSFFFSCLGISVRCSIFRCLVWRGVRCTIVWPKRTQSFCRAGSSLSPLEVNPKDSRKIAGVVSAGKGAIVDNKESKLGNRISSFRLYARLV